MSAQVITPGPRANWDAVLQGRGIVVTANLLPVRFHPLRVMSPFDTGKKVMEAGIVPSTLVINPMQTGARDTVVNHILVLTTAEKCTYSLKSAGPHPPDV